MRGDGNAKPRTRVVFIVDNADLHARAVLLQRVWVPHGGGPQAHAVVALDWHSDVPTTAGTAPRGAAGRVERVAPGSAPREAISDTPHPLDRQSCAGPPA